MIRVLRAKPMYERVLESVRGTIGGAINNYLSNGMEVKGECGIKPTIILYLYLRT